MKKLIFLFLIFGLVFSIPFPENIEDSELVLYISNGSVSNGTAVYVIPLTSPDLSSEKAMEKAEYATGVGIVPQSHADFYKPQYNAGTWKKSIETNAECYYLTGVDAGSAVCNMACHNGEDTSYFFSTYIQNVEEETLGLSMAYDQTVLVANAIIMAGGGSTYEENLGGAAPTQEETGSQEEETESTCSSVILILLTVISSGIYYISSRE